MAITAGMALAMSGIGINAIFSRNLLDRRSGTIKAGERRLANAARIAGATLVPTIGLGVFVWAASSDFKAMLSDDDTEKGGPTVNIAFI